MLRLRSEGDVNLAGSVLDLEPIAWNQSGFFLNSLEAGPRDQERRMECPRQEARGKINSGVAKNDSDAVSVMTPEEPEAGEGGCPRTARRPRRGWVLGCKGVPTDTRNQEVDQ